MSKQYYDINRCSNTNLSYVRFNKKGLEALIEMYKAKYSAAKIDIEILEILDYDPKEFAKAIKFFFDKLSNSEIKGIITLKFSMDMTRISHACPFLIAKNQDGELVIANFEKHSFVDRGREELEFVHHFKEVINYEAMQKDFNSCTILSLSVLKNCFLDQGFGQDIFDKSSDKLQLSKMKYAQGGKQFVSMTAEQKEKYVFQWEMTSYASMLPELKDVNLGLFYKGHALARLLNDEHLDFISSKSKELIMRIDKIRRDFKEKKIQQAGDLEFELFNLEDLESLLPDRKISNPLLEKGFETEREK